MSDAHEEHESLIKTPQQLIAVVVLSFVVFVGLAMLVAQFVSSGIKGAQNGSAEATAKAIGKAMRHEPGIDWLLENQNQVQHYFHQLAVEGKLG